MAQREEVERLARGNRRITVGHGTGEDGGAVLAVYSQALRRRAEIRHDAILLACGVCKPAIVGGRSEAEHGSAACRH